jgi:hypothetical protein
MYSMIEFTTGVFVHNYTLRFELIMISEISELRSKVKKTLSRFNLTLSIKEV